MKKGLLNICIVYWGLGVIVCLFVSVFVLFFCVFLFSRLSAPLQSCGVRRHINFSHSRLLLWSGISANIDRKQDLNVLYKVCVNRTNWKKKMVAPASDWLRHFRLLHWNLDLNGIQRNLKGSKISTSSTKFVVFGPIWKTRWPSRHLIDWDIFDFSSVTAIWISTKLGRKQDLNVLYQGCVFSADWKNKMATPASDWLRHSRLLLWNRWMEFNKIYRKQDLNVFYHGCVFRADWRNKITAPVCDWLRHFRFLLWNHWMEFNKIWHDARSQHPLISLCFCGSIGGTRWPPSLWFAETFRLLLRDRWTRFNETWQEARSQRPLPICVIRADKYGRPGLWLAQTFSTSPLWPLNRIQRYLTGSKISTSSTKFLFFDETWQEARYQCPIQSFFSGRSEKQDGCPGLRLPETFSTSPLNGIQQNLTGNKICKRHLPSLCFSGRSEKTLYSGLRYVALGPLVCVLSRNETI